MGILRQCRLAGIANSKWIPILHEDMSKNEKDQPSGSNPWLLGSYHLPAPRDQRGHPRSNPHVGKGTRPKKNKLQKGVVGVTWSTHATSKLLTRFPAMILIDHHDSIGDNWPWASFGDFWHWKQNGSHLWDRIQHLLLVNTIEMGNNDADAKKKLEPCMMSHCPSFFAKV